MPVHDYPKPEFRPFRLIVKIEGYNRLLTVLKTLKGIGEEQYKIIARNRTLVLSTNKPIIERRGLKDFPWTWKLISGELQSKSAYEAIVEALEAHLRGKNKPGGGLYRHN